MIFRITFEEIAALNSAAERLLAPTAGEVPVVAPPEAMAELEYRVPLGGDLTVETLAQQRRLLSAVEYVLDHLKRRMDAMVSDQYVGSDDSVNAYFDYANVLTVATRLREAGRPGHTPAAVVQLGTYPAQRTVVGGMFVAAAADGQRTLLPGNHRRPRFPQGPGLRRTGGRLALAHALPTELVSGAGVVKGMEATVMTLPAGR